MFTRLFVKIKSILWLRKLDTNETKRIMANVVHSIVCVCVYYDYMATLFVAVCLLASKLQKMCARSLVHVASFASLCVHIPVCLLIFGVR